MPPTLSAANKLRNQVLSVPNTVLLVQAGHPDEVVRFNRYPERLREFFKEVKEKDGYTVINLDAGPPSEAWREVMEDVERNAKRDRPIPRPLRVAPDAHEEWSVSPEDVPLIEFEDIKIVTPVSAVAKKEAAEKPASLNCGVCGKVFTQGAGLKIHVGRYHKELVKE